MAAVEWDDGASAHSQIREWIVRAATARGWTDPGPEETGRDLDEIRRANPGSDSGPYLQNVIHYLRSLQGRGVAGADKLIATVVSALQASASKQAQDHARSILTILGGTVSQSAIDAKAAGIRAGSFFMSPGGMTLSALALVAVMFILRKFRGS